MAPPGAAAAAAVGCCSAPKRAAPAGAAAGSGAATSISAARPASNVPMYYAVDDLELGGSTYGSNGTQSAPCCAVGTQKSAQSAHCRPLSSLRAAALPFLPPPATPHSPSSPALSTLLTAATYSASCAASGS